ncbi:hypothetical protein ACQP1P_01435 [Dactylosporangium sp. CA-052675]|uniref:hypothetical protein n=1 Tax=Dactylosporangium sp. CA-052675 TaxID=3239927 RepID=UPI003D931A7A
MQECLVALAYLAERRRPWARRVRPAAEVPVPAMSPPGVEERVDVRAALGRLTRGQRAVRRRRG